MRRRVSSPIGSAPRVRGTGQAKVENLGHWRFSPARAGNGGGRAGPDHQEPVQPRACGERIYDGTNFVPTVGSAPRVRGTGYQLRGHMTADRFSPARAGNGDWLPPEYGESAVQPRACGERGKGLIDVHLHAGSAPRVRGTGSAAICCSSDSRFSPARAGNGRPPVAQDCCPAVQPRACGERTIASTIQVGANGSAPRVRGTDLALLFRPIERRFSPARAGNGTFGLSLHWVDEVQPRACGERASADVSSQVPLGSAPRVRGTVHRCQCRGWRHRFSPARAGNGARQA